MYKILNNWINSSKKKVLIIKHYEESYGGVGTVVNLFISHIPEFSFAVLYPWGNDFRLELYDQGKILMEIEIPESFELYNKLAVLLVFLKIDLINIQHLFGYKEEQLLKKIWESNVKYIFSLEDLYFYAGSIKYFYKTEYLEKISASRQNFIQKIFDNSAKVTFVSEFLRRKYHKKYKFKNMVLISPGLENLKTYRKFAPNSKLRILFIGVLSKQKGIDVFLNLIKELSNRFKWYLFGSPTEEFYALVEKYDLIKNADYVQSLYNKTQIQNLLLKNKIDIAIFPTKVPESFSLTLSEVFNAGIPAISFNIGAIAERIKHNKSGWVVNNYRQLKLKMIEINENRGLLERAVNNVNSQPAYSADNTALSMKKVIDSIVINRSGEKTDKKLIQEFLNLKKHSSLDYKLRRFIWGRPLIRKTLQKARILLSFLRE